MLGKLINRLHILQNIYLKNRYLSKKISYAMDGEDIAINLFNKKEGKGFYVDIGAHHPIQRNNTNLLYQKGWEGINIDINEFFMTGEWKSEEDFANARRQRIEFL